MENYVAILTLSPPLDAGGLHRLWRQACLDLYRVEWVRAYLSQDGGRVLCWYRAPDAESVRFILRQLGDGGGPVWRSEVSPDDIAECDPGGACCVAVEKGGEHGPGREDAVAAKAALTPALAAAGFTVIRQFSALQGERQICLVQGRAEAAVRDCLRTSGLPADAVWACTELDPAPQTLFRSIASARTAGDSVTANPASSGRPADRRIPSAAQPQPGTPDEYDVVIIGAGIAGIAMLARLRRMQLRVLVFESGSDIGGVWYWNRYPGARVDSESFTYGFDFGDQVLPEWRWSELFAAQPEVYGYLQYVVEKLRLRPHIRTGTRVAAARYIESEDRWEVAPEDGETVSARYLVAATGALTAPQLPDYPGHQEFSGDSHHTARWPASGLDLAGKRVGVIGTGATGVQVIQTIASEAGFLTVFQRTPTYCIPQRNRRLSASEWHRIQCDLPSILAICRESWSGFMHVFDPRPGLAVSRAAREAKFEELWQQPGFAFWFANFGDLMMSTEVNAHACEFLRQKIRARVHDPEVARRLLPDHPFGAKRVPLENGYYEAYNRANVRLVDLRETPIRRMTRDGIITAEGKKHTLDIIIYATGFDAGTGALTRIDIHGPNGITLADKWRPGAHTYLGLLVHGFPNLFIVNGPQNSAALCNATRCIEQNVEWIAECIRQLRERGLARVEPTADAEQEWTAHVEEVARASVLREMTESWFFGANTPGKARQATIYAAGARAYREHCERAARVGYPGLIMSDPG